MTSRGSVIPLFVSQIKRNNPLTITDPNMTRFLMSLDESVDLVLHAFKYGKPGDLFVQKAPAATIHNLANSIMKIFKTKVPIKIIGTRHGEKLYESLLTREELAKAKSKGKYYVVKMDARDLNYGKYFFKGQISTSESKDYTSHNTKRLNNKELEVLLKKLKLKIYNMIKIFTVIGTRPEIIKLSRVIYKLDRYFNNILVHTGQNFDYELNKIFFNDLGLRKPDYFLDAAKKTVGETVGEIFNKIEKLL